MALTYGYAEQARVITSKLVAQAALDRSKGGILPLSAKEDLDGLAAAHLDSSELEDPIPMAKPAMFSEELVSGLPIASPEEAYTQGMALKDEGRLKEAVDMFHSAARDKSMWLKAYKQVGLCYMKMREPQAATHAFRTALNDQAASPKDIIEVLYYLARSLESVGETSEACEVYRRISQSTPTFRDVADRLKQLRQTSKQVNKRRGPTGENDSWFSGVIDNVQRLLTGSQK
jgi:tetratricopeptide (TPR) repeat protein